MELAGKVVAPKTLSRKSKKVKGGLFEDTRVDNWLSWLKSTGDWQAGIQRRIMRRFSRIAVVQQGNHFNTEQELFSSCWDSD